MTVPELRAERVHNYYQRSASRYDDSIRMFERLFLGDGRAWAASHASGRVLEIGIGTGRNLPFYAPGARLVGVDLSPAMLAIARGRALQLGIEIDLREGNAEHLQFCDDSFDTAVCTAVLCSIPDDRAALTEIRRVLRPGGCLVLLEHVRSPLWPVRSIQHLLEPLMVRFESDHLVRDPLDHLPALGFHIEFCERARWGIMERVVARKRRTGAAELVV